MVGKYLSAFEKGRIVALHDAGLSCSDIATKLKRSKRTIERLVFSDQKPEMIRTGQATPPKPKSGRPKCTSAHLDRLIKRAITENPRLSATALKTQFAEELQGVAIRTIQYRLKVDLGFDSRHAAQKPLLTAAMKKKRMAFAKKHQSWSVEDWKKVMFSDESTFRLVRGGIVRVRRPAGSDRYASKYCSSTVKHPPSVMVWGCFSGLLGRGSLWFLPKGEMMNSTNYLKCLEEKLIPFMEIHGTTKFLQDGAPCHKAKRVMDYLKSQRFEVIDWPGNSPDLNPIENVWNVMKNRVREASPSNMEDLMQTIKTVWVTMPMSYFDNLVKSMPERMKLVIKARGEMTKY